MIVSLIKTYIAANILRRSNLPKHKNTTAAERKALEGLKKDKTRVVMKTYKSNCFVVMDKKEYNEKMQVLLSDPRTAVAPYCNMQEHCTLQYI